MESLRPAGDYELMYLCALLDHYRCNQTSGSSLQARARHTLFVRAASHSSAASDRIEWSGPLTITVEEIDKALDILKPVIAGVKPDG